MPSRVGSFAPTTTFAISARTTASTHGGCEPVVVAGLEGHEDRRSSRSLPGSVESDDLRMRPSLPLVPALTDDLAVPDDDRADDRIRMRRPPPALRELESPLEHQPRASRRR